MNVPTDLPSDLQHEVAERAVQPGFDAVLARAGAGRRRRRTTIASGLAVAVVVVGLAAVAGGVAGDDGRSPEPAAPVPTTPWDGVSSPDPRLPSDVVAVLDDERLQLWSITGGPRDAVAVVWLGCDTDPCRYVLVTRDGDEVFGEAVGDAYPIVTGVPGGWLVEDPRGTSLLAPSGERSDVVDTGPGDSDVMAGDTAVPIADGWRLLRGTKLVPIPVPAPDADVIAAYVTPDGRLVVASTTTGTSSQVATLGPDGSWTSSFHASEAPGDRGGATARVLAGNGDHVALATLGDDPDGSVPVLGVEVSHDAGRTWTPAVNLDTDGGDRVRNMSALAVAADGTTYLTTESHHLVRVDDQGFATPIQLSAFDTGVFASGDRVCLVGERGHYDALLCSPDGITEWADQPLPGLG